MIHVQTYNERKGCYMGDEKTSMTIVLSRSDKKALKKLAVERDTTVSKLVSTWLHDALREPVQQAEANNDGRP